MLLKRRCLLPPLEKGQNHEYLSEAGSLPFDGRGNLNASISYFQKEATHCRIWKKDERVQLAMQIQALDPLDSTGKALGRMQIDADRCGA